MIFNPIIRTPKIIVFTFLLILFCDFFDRAQYIEGMPRLAAATYVIAVFKYISVGFLLFILLRKKKQLKQEIPRIAYFLFLLWSAWCVITLARGLFSAGDYWEWKFLLTDNVLRYSVHFAIIVGLYLTGFQKIYFLILKKLFIFSFFLLYFSSGSFDYFFSYMVMPVTLIMLTLPFVKKRDWLIIFLVAFCSLILSLDFRANAMRLAFGFGLVLIIYFRKFIPYFILKAAVVVMMVLPVVFLYFGVTGQFNPFTQVSKVEATKHYSQGEEENLTVDTRTFLYIETLQTLKDRNSFLFGEGGAGSYNSVYSFDYLIDARRFATEVGFLNILLHSGVVGVTLYFFILLLASYYGVWKSNNLFSKILGLAIAFRWIMFFIEDMTAFNMSMFFLWIAIGLSFSKTVRAMSDDQIRNLFQLKSLRHI